MSMRMRLLGILPFLLAGCEAVMAPVAIVTAPIAAVVEQSRIRQPVSVISQDGTVLAGPSEPTIGKDRTFQITPDTVLCSAKHDSRSINDHSMMGVLFKMTCDNGYFSLARFEDSIGAKLFKFGLSAKEPEIVALKPADVNFLMVCTSEFRKGKGTVQPFEIQCGRDRTLLNGGEFSSTYNRTGVAAVSTVAVGPSQNETTIWINFAN